MFPLFLHCSSNVKCKHLEFIILLYSQHFTKIPDSVSRPRVSQRVVVVPTSAFPSDLRKGREV